MSTKPPSDVSDPHLVELRKIAKSANAIAQWVMFLGIMVIVGAAFALLFGLPLFVTN